MRLSMCAISQMVLSCADQSSFVQQQNLWCLADTGCHAALPEYIQFKLTVIDQGFKHPRQSLETHLNTIIAIAERQT